MAWAPTIGRIDGTTERPCADLDSSRASSEPQQTFVTERVQRHSRHRLLAINEIPRTPVDSGGSRSAQDERSVCVWMIPTRKRGVDDQRQGGIGSGNPTEHGALANPCDGICSTGPWCAQTVQPRPPRPGFQSEAYLRQLTCCANAPYTRFLDARVSVNNRRYVQSGRHPGSLDRRHNRCDGESRHPEPSRAQSVVNGIQTADTSAAPSGIAWGSCCRRPEVDSEIPS